LAVSGPLSAFCGQLLLTGGTAGLCASLATSAGVGGAYFQKAVDAPASLGNAITADFKLTSASDGTLDPKFPTDSRATVITATASLAGAVGHSEDILGDMGAREGGYAEARFLEWVCHGSLSFRWYCDVAVKEV
jgi:hypothetical protein